MLNFPFELPSARLRPAKKRQENLQGGFDSGAGRTPARAERPKSGRSCANQQTHRTPKCRARASIFLTRRIHAHTSPVCQPAVRSCMRPRPCACSESPAKSRSLSERPALLPFRFPSQHLTYARDREPRAMHQVFSWAVLLPIRGTESSSAEVTASE